MQTRWRVFAVTALGVFTVYLDGTIVNIAFPAIHRTFPTVPQPQLSWVLNAYSIVFAALLLTAGQLADRVGRRRFFFAGLLIFNLGSVLCGAAPSAYLLIAARILQAVGAALLGPTALALLLAAFPQGQRTMAVGLYGAVAAVAAALGPSLGSLIVDQMNWRWAFLINVPVGLAAWLAGRRVLQESRDQGAAGRADWIGIAALIATMGALALGIVQGNDWGWRDSRTLASFTVAALGVPFCIRRAAGQAAPVIDLALFRIRSFSVANLATVLFAAAFFALLLENVLFLTTVWRYTILQAGLAVTPGPICAAIAAGPAAKLAHRYGHRVVLVPGALIFAAAVGLLMTQLTISPAFLGRWLPITMLAGIGVGLALPTLSSASAVALPPEHFARGSAVFNTARQFGAVLGVAILISLLGTPAPGGLLDAFDRAYGFCLVMAAASGVACLALGRTAPALAPAPLAIAGDRLV